MVSSKPFRINTCKSVSKQTTSTIFRINTYEKHRGWVVIVNQIPDEGICPERAQRVEGSLFTCHDRRFRPCRKARLSRATEGSRRVSPVRREWSRACLGRRSRGERAQRVEESPLTAPIPLSSRSRPCNCCLH